LRGFSDASRREERRASGRLAAAGGAAARFVEGSLDAAQARLERGLRGLESATAPL